MKSFKKIVLAAAFAGICPAASYAAFNDVTGFDGGGWHVAYQYHIIDQTLNGRANFYDADNSVAINASGQTIDRVAYYMELNGASPTGNEVNGYAFVSFNTISTDATKLGIPTTQSGEFYQQNVSNMNVLSNVTGVQTGNGLAGGNIEFWPSNYGTGNVAVVPNADAGLYDIGDNDANTSSGFGSLQIHNHALTTPDIHSGTNGQTIIAFNQWGGTNGNDLGIGNQPKNGSGQYVSNGGPNPDWTFRSNVGQYGVDGVHDIQVLVHYQVPEPASAAVIGLAATGLFARRRRA